MKLRIPPCLAVVLPVVSLLLLAGGDAAAQRDYRNIVNMRFRTVSDGPQSAIIVDVPNPADTEAVAQAALRRYSERLRAQRPAFQREIAFLRRHGMLRPGQQIPLADAAIVRHNGKLALPAPNKTRAPNDNITFQVVTQGNGAFGQADAAAINNLIQLIYPQLRGNAQQGIAGIFGAPAWNGTVEVKNLDPRLGMVDEVIGALLVVNGNDIDIYFPTFRDFETRFLAMAQVMAQAFHGPRRMAYDAWEQGMGRAAAVVVARNLQPFFQQQSLTVNPANAFYYTPNYDLLNQPPLGNNTFTPDTKSDQPFNPTTLSGMLVPRLQMASTAWLKCYIENPNFFKLFNTGSADGQGTGGYNGAVTADPAVANNVSRLRDFARAAVPQVEGLDFDDWFERQYVLDTSVTPGVKLYVYTLPTYPQTGDDSGAAFFVVYYQTTPTGDEIDRNGQSFVVYWDYNFANRLTLPSFEQIDIVNGFGTVAPFFTNIGGNPADKMRVAADFPIGKEYARVYFPAGLIGTEANPADFSGIVVGADAGSLQAVFDGGGSANVEVQQGGFGAFAPTAVPNGFSRATFTFTPTGGQPITYRRNTAFNNTIGVAPIFQFVAPGPVSMLSHTFPQGVQMASLPFQPLQGDLAALLGTNPAATLLAQWRQDSTVGSGTDRYLRYPNMPRYLPGYAFWTNFPAPLAANNMAGERTDVQKHITVGLLFGWNQIGPPYNTDIDVTTDLQFQLQADNAAVSLQQAIQNGWIAAGIQGYSLTTGYVDITNTNTAQAPRNILQPWRGYWIRVLMTEGITLTYINPNNRAAPRTRSAPAAPREAEGWRVPLYARDASGLLATATFGQSPRGSEQFVPALSVASAPPFAGGPQLAIRFPHPEWDAGYGGGSGGEFLTDIRRSGARSEWEFVVTVPQPEQNYTLAWSDTATLPRGTRLTLIDAETGRRQLMNSTSGFSFRAGSGQTTRRFRILAEPRSVGRLAIRNIAAVLPQVGGRAVGTVTISYELTAAAETRIEIRSGGRVVRRLATGRAAAAGLNQIVWDTRDEQGRTLPGGLYSVEVTARAPEGERTRQVAPLLLTR